MKAKKLFGKEVIDVDARVVGKVEDVELDISKAAIQNVLIKSGLTRKLSISPEDIDKVGDKVVLKIARDKIRKA